MNKLEKDIRLDELGKISESFTQIKNPVEAMRAYLTKFVDFIEAIWKDGYNEGFKAGKKSWVKDMEGN